LFKTGQAAVLALVKFRLTLPGSPDPRSGEFSGEVFGDGFGGMWLLGLLPVLVAEETVLVWDL
jgi:hypothetical protein